MSHKPDENIKFRVITWPTAYGVSNKSVKINKIGFYMPSHEFIYPSRELNHINGYDPPIDTKHYITDGDSISQSIIHNFINFIVQCKNRNPNVIDSLYTGVDFIETKSNISQLVIDNRNIFTGPTMYHSYYEQAVKNYNKLCTFRISSENHRTHRPTRHRNKKTIKCPGLNYDVELAVSCVRLMNQALEWVTYGSNDLQSDSNLHNDMLKGEFTWKEVSDHYKTLKQRVNDLKPTDIKINSDINESSIREFLKNCLEEYYGTMEKSKLPNQLISDLDNLLSKYKS